MTKSRRTPAVSRSLKPPVGGWNRRDALADMPVTDAYILDNWFPVEDKVFLRRGFAEHATGMSGAVETLMTYTGVDGDEELFGANDGNIYDVSSAGSVGTAKVNSLTNDRWQYVNMGTSGGQFLLAMNGADTPITYDGTNWSTASISGSGLTAANLIWCCLHQRRLWMGEEDSLDAWYLGTNAISGTATKFPLAGIASLGGYIMAMGTWSRDGGEGADDVAVFVTSQGQVILYSGYDPSDATLWSLVGVFNIGKPIGRRCLVKFGAELIIITEDGFMPLSAILSLDRAEAKKFAISAKIDGAVNEAVTTYRSVFGWQPILYPEGKMIIFNIPQSTTISHQYVFNTNTKAPCRFTGVNAVCWGLLDNKPYFGGADGKVYQFDTGTDDNGAAIAGDALQAFSNFGYADVEKAFKGVEPIFQSGGDPSAAVDLNIDYEIKAATGIPEESSSSSAKWGIDKWGIGTWGSQNQIWRGWRGVRGKGRAAAVRIRCSLTNSRPAWISTNFRFVPGGNV